MPHWSFGCPSDWLETPRDIQNRSQVEHADEKTRPLFTRAVVDIQARWILRNYNRQDGYNVAHTFFKVDCRNGSLSFSMVHPWTGLPRMYKFKTTPTYGSLENKWCTVAAELVETLPYVPAG